MHQNISTHSDTQVRVFGLFMSFGVWPIVGVVSESQDTVVGNDPGVALTPAAAGTALALLSQEGRSDLRLRIAVDLCGCPGLCCSLFFDERSLHDDIVIAYPAPQNIEPRPADETLAIGE